MSLKSRNTVSAKTRWATTREDADVVAALEAEASAEVVAVEVVALLETVKAVTDAAATPMDSNPAVTVITKTKGMASRTVAKKAETAGEEEEVAVPEVAIMAPTTRRSSRTTLVATVRDADRLRIVDKTTTVASTLEVRDNVRDVAVVTCLEVPAMVEADLAPTTREIATTTAPAEVVAVETVAPEEMVATWEVAATRATVVVAVAVVAWMAARGSSSNNSSSSELSRQVVIRID